MGLGHGLIGADAFPDAPGPPAETVWMDGDGLGTSACGGQWNDEALPGEPATAYRLRCAVLRGKVRGAVRDRV